MPKLARCRVSLVAVPILAAGVAVSALTGSGSAAPARSAAQQSLGAALDTILADPRFDGASEALTVRDADTGAVVYQRDGGQRLLPASNAKLFTSAAAMDVLGPGFRFATDVLRSGRLRRHVLAGNLYLKGFGDPMATAADYDALAARVAAAGVRTVRGALIADDSYYDDARLAPFWSWDDEPFYYSAQTSALNIAPDDIGDTGTVLVDVAPGRHAGDRPRVTMTPRNSYVRIRNSATTGAGGSTETVDAVREHGRNVVDVTGSIPLGAADFAAQPTVDDPTGLVADVFRHKLRAHGVRVLRGTHEGPTPGPARRIARHESAPLAQVLTPFLKLSNNMIAETLTKAMGRQESGAGTWSAGTAAILADATANGVDASTLRLFDGSGLGRADYLTTDQITAELLALRSKPWFDTWFAALPIAGEPDQLVGGTLRNRMKGTAAAGNLHGKTGSMTGVSALAGYLTDAQGHHLVFSMLSNDFVHGSVTSLEDAVAVTLADYDGTSASSTHVTRPRPATSTGRAAQLECSWTRSC
jgi:D-alanyl-D-alanine carboxypeptidase/D-alanyl-D-alanine-endopeptidase (penicillin-binding protein 4)